LGYCHGHGVINKPAQSVLGWKLTVWFSITGTGLMAENGKRLNRLSHLTKRHATMVDTGHGSFALDAGSE
jgi:hypothetical protein